MRVLPLLALLAALATGAYAGGVSLLEFELRSLDQPEAHALERYEGKPVIMVFFEPECSWCLRQVRAINEIDEMCGDEFDALAIGVNATRAALQKELRRLRPNFPAYQASPELLESLGGIPATPISLLGDARGEFVSWARGYKKVDELLSLMREDAGLACASG